MDKQTLQNIPRKHAARIFELGGALFNCPEPGYAEWETRRAATAYLSECGVPYTDGLALTGFRAALGSGSYHIAVTADMDAPLVAKGERYRPFHSCGHSIQMTVGLAVMQALHESRFLDGLDAKVSFIATPAEEFIDLDFREGLRKEGKIRRFSGKQELIEAGVFDDVDCVLNLHISGGPACAFDVGTALSGFSVKKCVFTGRGAHSGAAAHEGRNALHGAVLCMQACAFLAEQFPHCAGLQLHPIITEGGGSMNVVPERAVLETYIRALTHEDLSAAMRKFDTVATHSAAALGIGCLVETTAGYMPLSQDFALCGLLKANMETVVPGATIAEGLVNNASGDVGDLSFLLPTAQFGFSGFSGRIHSSDFAITDREHVYLNTAAVLLGAIADLAENPATRPAKTDSAAKKTQYLQHWLGQTSNRQS